MPQKLASDLLVHVPYIYLYRSRFSGRILAMLPGCDHRCFLGKNTLPINYLLLEEIVIYEQHYSNGIRF